MEKETVEKETYLGDGLYASFDGYQIKLSAPDIGGDRVVYLESAVIAAFMRFVEAIRCGNTGPQQEDSQS